MIGPDQPDSAIFLRIARRVGDILEAARERELRGQSLSLDIDARFHLQDSGAIQFQLASAILEEVGGLQQEEVVSELLSLGLAAVLDRTARVVGDSPMSAAASDEELQNALGIGAVATFPLAARTIN